MAESLWQIMMSLTTRLIRIGLTGDPGRALPLPSTIFKVYRIIRDTAIRLYTLTHIIHLETGGEHSRLWDTMFARAD